MDDNLHHIDDIFKDSIETLNETPTSRIWENITSKLDAEDAKHYKRKFIIAKRFASVLFILLLFLLVFNFTNNRNKNILLVQQQTAMIKKGSYSPDGVNQNRSNIHELRKNERMRSAPLLKKDLSKNGEIINQFVDSSKGESAKNGKGYTQYANNQRISATKFYNEAFTRKNINTDINLGLVQPILPNKLLVKLPDTSNHIFTEVNLKPIPVLILHENKNSIPFKSFFDFTVFGSSVWAKYYLEDDLPDNVFAQNTVQNSLQASTQHVDRSIIEERENPELSFNAGILVGYNFRKHLSFQTGLIYNTNYISIQPQKVYASPDAFGNIGYKLITSSGYGFVNPNFSNTPTFGDSLHTTSVQHNLQYLNIPFLLKYNMSINKLAISPGLGVSVSLLTSSSIRTELENSLTSETVSISKLQGTQLIHLGLLASAEIKYAFSNKWALDLIPALSYAVTPVTKNNVVKTYPYNFSFGIGINYKFN